MLVACIEHAAELRWAPAIKLPAVSWAGLVAVVVGELLRKAAMVRLLLDGFSCLLIGKIAWAACKLAHAVLRCNEHGPNALHMACKSLLCCCLILLTSPSLPSRRFRRSTTSRT